MNRVFITSLLSVIISLSLPNATMLANVSPVTSTDISEECATERLEIMYSDSIGFYFKKEIPQGLEFVLVGKEADRLGFSKPSRSTYDYFNPDTPISKVSGDRMLTGVWWGGIMKDLFVAGGVVSTTKATTKDTQSKASVKPGISAAWSSSDWMDTNVWAHISESVGIMGNQAKWDLREK